MVDILYPDEHPTVHRRSSIDQFSKYLSVMKQGGWAPIVFDQLDGIRCKKILYHPVAISFDPNELGYIFPEAHCTYASDHFVYFDKKGVEEKLLPECFGGGGEFYLDYVNKSTFINFDNDDSVGVHNTLRYRTGLSYVVADETLPPVE